VNASVPGGFRNVPSQPQRTRSPPRGRSGFFTSGPDRGITRVPESRWVPPVNGCGSHTAPGVPGQGVQRSPDAGEVPGPSDNVVAFTPDSVTPEVTARDTASTPPGPGTWPGDSPLARSGPRCSTEPPGPQHDGLAPFSRRCPQRGRVGATPGRVPPIQVVVVLEAMKMEHQVRAPPPGSSPTTGRCNAQVGAGTYSRSWYQTNRRRRRRGRTERRRDDRPQAGQIVSPGTVATIALTLPGATAVRR
jgi:hypothetical protein